jgi:hypothetical protein
MGQRGIELEMVASWKDKTTVQLFGWPSDPNKPESLPRGTAEPGEHVGDVNALRL